MFTVDKEKFGAFVSELRREKGYTQKELAERLCISDKAVSKWETAVSIPDTALLIPLAELLGVTVTELLLCERMEKKASMETGQVESIVKTAITYSEEKTMRAYQMKSRWPVIYLAALIVGVLGTLLNGLRQFHSGTLLTTTVLGAVFGAYFCIFVKTRLPVFYDENRFGLYYDNGFRMNIPGVAFTNSNWPHIVRVGRVWSCLLLALYPALNLVMNAVAAEFWLRAELYVMLVFLLGGLFVPMYVVGKKYE